MCGVARKGDRIREEKERRKSGDQGKGEKGRKWRWCGGKNNESWKGKI